MSKNHLTEGRVCVLYVLRSNCPTLPVKLDYPFAHRRAVARSCHFCRTAVWLFDFSRRLGDTRDQCHYQRPSLDDLLQTPGTRQCPDATTGKSLVRGGQRCIANGDAQSRSVGCAEQSEAHHSRQMRLLTSAHPTYFLVIALKRAG